MASAFSQLTFLGKKIASYDLIVKLQCVVEYAGCLQGFWLPGPLEMTRQTRMQCYHVLSNALYTSDPKNYLPWKSYNFSTCSLSPAYTWNEHLHLRAGITLDTNQRWVLLDISLPSVGRGSDVSSAMYRSKEEKSQKVLTEILSSKGFAL